MKRLTLILSFLASLNASAVEKPNIVLLFVDDWGWADMGFRNPEYVSPNIDKLAKESLSFEQAYVACPTCSPSRATLLTGLHPARTRMVRHIPTAPGKDGFDKFGRTEEKVNYWKTDPAKFPCPNWLNLEYTTYAEALSELGYYNQFIGKWHLGHEPYHPVHQGFDEQLGTSNWGHPKSYHPPYFVNSDVMANEKERYLTDKLTDETVAFIRGYDKNQPFMLSLWYYTVHGPHDGRGEYVEEFKKKGFDKKRANFAAMIRSLDDSVGRVREALEKKGIADNTVLILLSDQGGMFSNSPLRGGKRAETLYEGGARVPFFIRWPGVTKDGTRNASLVQTTDLFPTFVEIAGGDAEEFEKIDGVSLLETIREGGELERNGPIIGYRAYEDLYASVREGDWKLLAFRSGEIRLYNITKDISETTDLAKRNPEKVQELRKKLVKWEKEMGVEEYSGVK